MARPHLKDDRGAVSALVAVLIVTVFLILAALAIDLGFGYTVKAQASKASDAGALAGAVDLPALYVGTFSCGGIPSSGLSKVANDAGTYACNNASGATVTVTTPFKGNPFLVNVKVCKTQGTFFARIIGVDTITSCSAATAGRARDLPCKILVPTSAPAGSPDLGPRDTILTAAAARPRAPAAGDVHRCPWLPTPARAARL